MPQQLKYLNPHLTKMNFKKKKSKNINNVLLIRASPTLQDWTLKNPQKFTEIVLKYNLHTLSIVLWWVCLGKWGGEEVKPWCNCLVKNKTARCDRIWYLTFSNQIKSKSLLLSHHHSTSALVSEILMSVLQTVQKNNRQFTYGQTVQKKQQTIYLWTDSAKKTTNNLPMDRQCKKNNRQFTYGQTVQKNNKQFTYGQTVQKNNNRQFTYGQTVQKKQQQFTYGQTVQKSNSNLHMDSTYLQTVQKTMCKIHIHILSTHSVL